MSTTAMILGFEQIGIPIAPVNKMGMIPSEANALAAGLAAANVLVKDPVPGSWDTFAGTYTTAGYIAFSQTDNGASANGTVILIPTFIKTTFP